MKITKEQLNAEIRDLEGDPIPREQVRNMQTLEIETRKTWTYRDFLWSLYHNSTAKDKKADLLWSGAMAMHACNNGKESCELDVEQAAAFLEEMESSDRNFGLGIRMPVRQLLNGNSDSSE